MLLRDVCLEIYNYMYLNKYSKTYFCKTNDKKLIIDFLIELHKIFGLESVGAQYIYNYIGYQIIHHTNNHQKLSVSSVFGKKAIERYFKGLNSIDLFIVDKVLSEFNIQRSFINKYINEKIEVNQNFSDEFENLERKRYLNTSNGFINCFEKTTLYNRCSICIRCNEQINCKNILKDQYPNLYYERIGNRIN